MYFNPLMSESVSQNSMHTPFFNHYVQVNPILTSGMFLLSQTRANIRLQKDLRAGLRLYGRCQVVRNPREISARLYTSKKCTVKNYAGVGLQRILWQCTFAWISQRLFSKFLPLTLIASFSLQYYHTYIKPKILCYKYCHFLSSQFYCMYFTIY